MRLSPARFIMPTMRPSLDSGQTSPLLNTPHGHALVAGLQLCRLLGTLPDPLLEQLAAQTHAKRYDSGDILCRAEDPAQTIWMIVGPGWVKLSRETPGGAEAVWDVLGQGALIGLETLTSPHGHATTATAVGVVEALAIPQAALRALLETHPPFALNMLRHINKLSYDHKLEMEHRTQQTAAQRVGCFFLRLAGVPTSGGTAFMLPFDKGLVAARLGMQPETFSRALAKLRADTGLIADGAKVTIPDVPKLSAYTCHACSGTYPCLT